jgi:ribosomal protein S4
VREVARAAGGLTDRVAPWLLSDPEALVGRVVHEPLREQIQVPIDEQAIVEYYSGV